MPDFENSKKEEKVENKETTKGNSIQDRIKNMGGAEMPKKEDQKPKEEPKNTNSIKDRIKNMTGGEPNKKV